MTEGYLNGWLDFKPKTFTSKFREEYLLSVIERKLLADSIKLTVSSSASLASGSISKDTLATVTTAMRNYSDLALPYLSEKSKIKNSPNLAKMNDISFWKDLLSKKQAEIDQTKAK